MAGKLRSAGDNDGATNWIAAMQESKQRAIAVLSLLEAEGLRPHGPDG